jgi:hypothetical protein
MSLKSQLRRILNQKALYWAPLGDNQFNEKSYALPVVIKVRWEDKREEIVTAMGTRIVSNARLYMGTDVLEGGFVFLLLGGAKPPSTMTDQALISSIPNSHDPTRVENAREIYKFEKMPDRKVTEFLRTVYL